MNSNACSKTPQLDKFVTLTDGGLEVCELGIKRTKCDNANPKNIGVDGQVNALVPASFVNTPDPMMERCVYCGSEKDRITKECKPIRSENGGVILK